jgi:hypothetical protein
MVVLGDMASALARLQAKLSVVTAVLATLAVGHGAKPAMTQVMMEQDMEVAVLVLSLQTWQIIKLVEPGPPVLCMWRSMHNAIHR